MYLTSATLSNKTTFFSMAIVLFCLFSCGKSDEEIEKERLESRSDSIYQLNENARKLLISKYNASELPDSTFKFSFQLSEYLSKSNKLYFLENERIEDIVKIDSSYFIQTSVINSLDIDNPTTNCLVFLKFKKENLKYFAEGKSYGTFIFKIDKVSKGISEIEKQDENEEYIDSELANSIFIYSELLDYYFKVPE